MFSSTVIPTIGRASLLRAVESVLEQAFAHDDFEVIVVNDTGEPLPEAAWQQSKRVRVINTKRRRQSAARNAGAAIAKGRYLHFLDDDDWMLPGALDVFWQLAQHGTEAAWLYAGTQIVDRVGNPIVQLDHRLRGNVFIQVIAGEYIPLGASLIKTEDFFNVGGFNPLLPVSEDIDLCRRIALRGEVMGTATVVTCHGMGQGSSSPRHLDLDYSRWGRESILGEPGVFARMRASANGSYWRGRIVRAYLTSMVWNLRRKRVFCAASRATFGLAALGLAVTDVVDVDFWRAVTQSYRNNTFLSGLRAAKLAGNRDSGATAVDGQGARS